MTPGTVSPTKPPRSMRWAWGMPLLLIAAVSSCGPPPAPAKKPPPVDDPASEPRAEPRPRAKAAAATADPVFVNVAPQAGLTATLVCGGPQKNHILESTGSGAAFIDYDEDGLLDIFLVNAWTLEGDNPQRVGTRGHSVLYRNRGDGTFEDVTRQAGLDDDSWGCGVCAGDFDNDGHVDLYVTNFGRNRLYRNRGDGTFEEMAERAGVADPGWSAGAAFFDADGDGYPDLYVAHYIDCTLDDVLEAKRTNLWRDKVKVMVGPFGLRGQRDHFFHNNGDGTFSDWTDAAGLADTAESYGLGVLASDLDNDGDVDIYVANDSNPNFLYRNDGTGKFMDVGTARGSGLSAEGKAQAGMGVDAADIDGDGLQEIIVTNFAKDYATLYKNEGDLFFKDASVAFKIKDPTYEAVKWGCAFFDYDLDGDVDLFIVSGHIYPQVDSAPELHESYRQLPILLRNDGGRFTDVSRAAGPGLQIPISGRGLAVGDFDNDGDLDLLVTGIDAPPLLLRNDTPRVGHWLKVRLLNPHGSPALNARATITIGGKKQLREVRSGSTYCSQNSFDLHFGTGGAKQVDRLEVRWPDGQTTVEKNVPVDHLITIKQPKK